MRRIHAKKIDTPEYYDTRIWPEEMNQRPYYEATRMRELLRRVKDGDRVLDLGAGCFGPAQYAAEHTDLRAHLVALDFSRVAADLVTKRLCEARRDYTFLSFDYLISDAGCTGLPDAGFDVVVAGELIEHFEDPAILAGEMARLCKPGGWMAISTVNPDCDNARKHGDYPEHLWEFTPEDLIGFFAPYGIPAYYPFGDYHMLEVRRG